MQVYSRFHATDMLCLLIGNLQLQKSMSPLPVQNRLRPSLFAAFMVVMLVPHLRAKALAALRQSRINLNYRRPATS